MKDGKYLLDLKRTVTMLRPTVPTPKPMIHLVQLSMRLSLLFMPSNLFSNQIVNRGCKCKNYEIMSGVIFVLVT